MVDRAIPIGPTQNRVGNAASGAKQALAVRFAEAHPARVNQGAAKVDVVNRPVAVVPQAVVKPADITERTVEDISPALGKADVIPVLLAGKGDSVLSSAFESRSLGSAADQIYAKTLPLESVFPELKGVNPHYVENAKPGVNKNCVSCANATTARLSGDDLNALVAPSNGYGNRLDLLPSAPFGFAKTPLSVADAEAKMLRMGDGATGVAVIKQDSVDHVVNVVNKGGKVYFIDSQMGKVVILQPNVKVVLGTR